MLANKVKSWFKKFSKYIFYYRDGFFELPYPSSSPAVMIEGLKKMSFIKHNKLEQSLYSNNPFLKSMLRYRELEDGLWLIASETLFKKNVCSKSVHDEGPCGYYYLSFSIFESQVNAMQFNNVMLSSKEWCLHECGKELVAYHYKGTKGLFMGFVFNNEWLAKNISIKTLPEDNAIRQFMNSDAPFISWQNLVPNAETLSRTIWKIMEGENEGHFNMLLLKMNTLEIISSFFKNVSQVTGDEKYLTLHKEDRKSIVKVEKILLDNLTAFFPGIESLAQAVNMSPTKLKTTFKAVFGSTLFQYYQLKQMELARELVERKEMSIKEIALSLGYESPGKFAAAFKKHHSFLPSYLR